MRVFACLLLAMLPLCGCGKKKAPAQAKDAAAVLNPTLLTEAEHLGLASRVPVDVEFCLSTVNFRQHADALKKSRWWKEMSAYVEDNTPASKGGEAIPIDEVFLALGKGSAQELTVLRQLTDLYNETSYRGMMSGGATASLGLSFDIGKMIDAALLDTQLLESMILLLERFEMPPIMLGFATPEPEKLLQKISNTLQLSAWMGDAPQSRIVTTQKEQITVNEVSMTSILTVERRQAWLQTLVQLMPGITPEMRDRVSRALDVLANKSWVLALGFSKEKGRAYVAVAQQKSQVYLANAVTDSMLARPELRFADGQARRKELGLITCWDGAFINLLQSDEPFMPLVRGLLDGLRSEKMFVGAARALEPLVKDLGVAEQKFFENNHTNGAAVAWWEKGLNVAWEGGVNASSIPVFSAPSRFTPLLDDASMVLGISGQGAGTGLGRSYFEAWARLVHMAAAELVKAGVGGEQVAQILQWTDAAVLPQLLEIYGGTKTLWQKALGNDGAFLLDVGGKMPALPGLPPGGENVPLPRLAVVQDVKNRALIGTSWQRTETALQQLLKGLPLPQPMELPQVLTRKSKGVTSHAYALPLDSEDVMPGVSLTDQLFILGTSRRQQLQIVESVGRSGNALAAGMRVKLGIPKLREFLKAFATARGQTAQWQSLLRQLEPLDVLEARIWGEKGVARGTLTWGMHDVLSYD